MLLNTPIDAFKTVYDEDLFYKLFDVVNDEQSEFVLIIDNNI